MYAIVRNIKEGTEKKTKEHSDFFVWDMVDMIGGKFRFKKIPGAPGWYTECNIGYDFHKSWLKEVKSNG